jgi:hypothetical protein
VIKDLIVSFYKDPLWGIKTGIDSAFRHQQLALKSAGVRVLPAMNSVSQVVHINWYSPMSLLQIWKAKRNGQKVVVFAHAANDMYGSVITIVGTNGVYLCGVIITQTANFDYNLGDSPGMQGSRCV